MKNLEKKFIKAGRKLVSQEAHQYSVLRVFKAIYSKLHAQNGKKVKQV